MISVCLMACPSGPGAAAAGDPLPEEAADCPTDIDGDPIESRNVDVGDGASEKFVPYSDGDTAKMVVGNQGATMVTMVVRVEARPEDGQEACWIVRLESDFLGAFPGDPDAFDASQYNVQFVRDGDFFISSGAIYTPFSYSMDDLSGLEIELTVTVRGKEIEGVRAVHLVLE